MGDTTKAGTNISAVAVCGDRFARFGAILGLSATLMLWTVGGAYAVPFTNDLALNASAAFATGDAFVVDKGSQSGSFSIRQGGVDTSTSYSGVAVSAGSNPLAGSLTDLGDGLGVTAQFTAGRPGEVLAGIDMVLDVLNNSATDTYQITFAIAVDAAVDAEGADAFAHSEYTIDDSSGEIFFSDIASDTFYGDEKNGTALGTFGDPVDDIRTVLFDLVLAPGAAEIFDIAYTLEGGGFDASSVGTGAFTGFLSVRNVANLTTPQPVPEPGTLALLGVGLLGLGALSRRGQRRGS